MFATLLLTLFLALVPGASGAEAPAEAPVVAVETEVPAIADESEAAPAYDLERGLKLYRRGNVMFGLGGVGVLGGAAFGGLGYLIIASAQDDNVLGAILAIIVGATLFTVGTAAALAVVPLLAAGSLTARKGLRLQGYEVGGGWGKASWALFGVSVAGFLVALGLDEPTIPVVIGGGALVGAIACAGAQVVHNMSRRNSRVAVRPRVGRHEVGLALVGAF